MNFKTFGNYEQSQGQELSKYAAILGEMGFGAIDGQIVKRKLSRKSSIGLSDFWSLGKKEKFLREKGYRQAYKQIQRHEFLELESRKVVKHASLPRIMDIKTIAKVKNQQRSLDKPLKTLRFKTSSLMESPIKMKISGRGRLVSIDSLMDKCDSLMNDMDNVRKSAVNLKKIFKKNCGLLVERRKKISGFEISKIKSDMQKIG